MFKEELRNKKRGCRMVENELKIEADGFKFVIGVNWITDKLR